MHKITPGEVRLGLKHQRTWQERLQIEDMRGELRCVCVLVFFDRMGGEIQRKVHDALGLPGVSLQQTLIESARPVILLQGKCRCGERGHRIRLIRLFFE